jgi:hypothetical protein
VATAQRIDLRSCACAMLLIERAKTATKAATKNEHLKLGLILDIVYLLGV